MFDSSLKSVLYLGCVVIYIIGIVSRRRFKQKLAGYWEVPNRLVATATTYAVSSAGNGTSVL